MRNIDQVGTLEHIQRRPVASQVKFEWLTVIELSHCRCFAYAETEGGDRLVMDIFTNGVNVLDLEIGIRVLGAVGDGARVADVVDS